MSLLKQKILALFEGIKNPIVLLCGHICDKSLTEKKVEVQPDELANNTEACPCKDCPGKFIANHDYPSVSCLKELLETLKKPDITDAAIIEFIKDNFSCPITGFIPKEPVILTTCGHIFEAEAIRQKLAPAELAGDPQARNCPCCRVSTDFLSIKPTPLVQAILTICNELYLETKQSLENPHEEGPLLKQTDLLEQFLDWDNQEPLLYFLIKLDKPKFLHFLLKKPETDVTILNADNKEPIVFAVELKKYHLIDLFIEFRPKATGAGYGKALYLLIMQGQHDYAKKLIDSGCEKPGSGYGKTLLQLAVKGEWNYVSNMITVGKCRVLDEQDPESGNTTLHCAYQAGKWGIVAQLIDADADVLLAGPTFECMLRLLYVAGEWDLVEKCADNLCRVKYPVNQLAYLLYIKELIDHADRADQRIVLKKFGKINKELKALIDNLEYSALPQLAFYPLSEIKERLQNDTSEYQFNLQYALENNEISISTLDELLAIPPPGFLFNWQDLYCAARGENVAKFNRILNLLQVQRGFSETPHSNLLHFLMLHKKFEMLKAAYALLSQKHVPTGNVVFSAIITQIPHEISAIMVKDWLECSTYVYQQTANEFSHEMKNITVLSPLEASLLVNNILIAEMITDVQPTLAAPPRINYSQTSPLLTALIHPRVTQKTCDWFLSKMQALILTGKLGIGLLQENYLVNPEEICSLNQCIIEKAPEQKFQAFIETLLSIKQNNVALIEIIDQRLDEILKIAAQLGKWERAFHFLKIVGVNSEHFATGIILAVKCKDIWLLNSIAKVILGYSAAPSAPVAILRYFMAANISAADFRWLRSKLIIPITAQDIILFIDVLIDTLSQLQPLINLLGEEEFKQILMQRSASAKESLSKDPQQSIAVQVNGVSVLQQAVLQSNINKLKSLVALYGPTLLGISRGNPALLEQAIYRGNLALANFILDFPEAFDDEILSDAILKATQESQWEMVSLFLSKIKNQVIVAINFFDEENNEGSKDPFCYASKANQQKIITQLGEKKADPNTDLKRLAKLFEDSAVLPETLAVILSLPNINLKKLFSCANLRNFSEGKLKVVFRVIPESTLFEIIRDIFSGVEAGKPFRLYAPDGTSCLHKAAAQSDSNTVILLLNIYGLEILCLQEVAIDESIEKFANSELTRALANINAFPFEYINLLLKLGGDIRLLAKPLHGAVLSGKRLLLAQLSLAEYWSDSKKCNPFSLFVPILLDSNVSYENFSLFIVKFKRHLFIEKLWQGKTLLGIIIENNKNFNSHKLELLLSSMPDIVLLQGSSGKTALYEALITLSCDPNNELLEDFITKIFEILMTRFTNTTSDVFYQAIFSDILELVLQNQLWFEALWLILKWNAQPSLEAEKSLLNEIKQRKWNSSFLPLIVYRLKTLDYRYAQSKNSKLIDEALLILQSGDFLGEMKELNQEQFKSILKELKQLNIFYTYDPSALTNSTLQQIKQYFIKLFSLAEKQPENVAKPRPFIELGESDWWDDNINENLKQESEDRAESAIEKPSLERANPEYTRNPEAQEHLNSNLTESNQSNFN